MGLHRLELTCVAGRTGPHLLRDRAASGPQEVLGFHPVVDVFGPQLELRTEQFAFAFAANGVEEVAEARDLAEREVAADRERVVLSGVLAVVEIRELRGRGDSVEAGVHRRLDRFGFAPHHDRRPLWHGAVEHFVPCDHAAVHAENVRAHFVLKPGLGLGRCRCTDTFHGCARRSVFAPFLTGAFVATDVDGRAGKERGDVGKHGAAEFDGFVGEGENVFGDAPTRTRVFDGDTAELGVCGDDGFHVPGHVNFGHDLDAELSGSFDERGYLVARVVAAAFDSIVFRDIVAVVFVGRRLMAREGSRAP